MLNIFTEFIQMGKYVFVCILANVSVCVCLESFTNMLLKSMLIKVECKYICMCYMCR